MEDAQFLFHGAKLLVHLFDHMQKAAKHAPRDLRQTRGRSVLNETRQIGHFTNAFARNETEFGKVGAKSVDQHGALLAKKSTCSMQCGQRLAFDALDRYEAHGRAAGRIANRLGVDGVGLAAFGEGPCIGWRDQAYLVPQSADLACPVMRRAACFHDHRAGRKLGKER
jgi:hypothetical protein